MLAAPPPPAGPGGREGRGRDFSDRNSSRVWEGVVAGGITWDGNRAFSLGFTIGRVRGELAAISINPPLLPWTTLFDGGQDR